MRRNSRPHDFAREAELVEQPGFVLGDSPGENLCFPRRGGNLMSLQLSDDLKQAVCAMKLGARRQMLPARKKAVELLSRHGLDFTAQPPQSHAMDPSKHAPVAPFDLAARGSGSESTSESLTFGLKLCQSDLDILSIKGESFRQPRKTDPQATMSCLSLPPNGAGLASGQLRFGPNGHAGE